MIVSTDVFSLLAQKFSLPGLGDLKRGFDSLTKNGYAQAPGALGCVQNLMHHLRALLAAFSIRISFQFSLVDELKIPDK